MIYNNELSLLLTELLLNSGINIHDDILTYAIINAIKNGAFRDSLRIIKLIREKMNDKEYHHDLASTAIEFRRLDVLKYLIEISETNPNKMSLFLLFDHAQQIKDIDIIRYLIKSGAKIYEDDILRAATIYNDLEMFRVLVESYPNRLPNLGAHTKNQIIISAIRNNNMDLLHYLIDNGVNISDFERYT